MCITSHLLPIFLTGLPFYHCHRSSWGILDTHLECSHLKDYLWIIWLSRYPLLKRHGFLILSKKCSECVSLCSFPHSATPIDSEVCCFVIRTVYLLPLFCNNFWKQKAWIHLFHFLFSRLFSLFKVSYTYMWNFWCIVNFYKNVSQDFDRDYNKEIQFIFIFFSISSTSVTAHLDV